jgi:hypothetical protein
MQDVKKTSTRELTNFYPYIIFLYWITLELLVT